MRRLVVALAVCASALVCAPTAASAKGAIDGVLRGPHVGGSGVAELDQGQTARLASATSFYTAVWGGGSSESQPRRHEPNGRLGPKYAVTYHLMVGQDETVPVRQALYPFAANGPVAYTPAGQPIQAETRKQFTATGDVIPCQRCRSTGGWFDVRPGALDVLRDVGVPIPTRSIQRP
jgi:hypothetical protein